MYLRLLRLKENSREGELRHNSGSEALRNPEGIPEAAMSRSRSRKWSVTCCMGSSTVYVMSWLNACGIAYRIGSHIPVSQWHTLMTLY